MTELVIQYPVRIFTYNKKQIKVMSKDDLVKVMQIAISLLDKGDASKANGVLKIGLTGYFNSGR
jgi:hypothetical protein